MKAQGLSLGGASCLVLHPELSALHGTPGSVLPQCPSPSLSSSMFSEALYLPFGPHMLRYPHSSLSASLLHSSLQNAVGWHAERYLSQQMGSQRGSEEGDGRAAAP